MRRVAIVGFAATVLFTGCLGRTTTAPGRPDNLHAELGTAPARIVSLNSEQGFVVIDFTSGIVPVVGTILNVYRNGKPVGAVRITEPMRAEFATADIVEGEVHVGDGAR